MQGKILRLKKLIIHANDATDTLTTEHQIKSFVDVSEGDFMGYEFLQFQSLVHIQIDDTRDVGTRFVVAIEGSLECFFTQKLQWVSLENCIFLRNSHQNSHTPSIMDAFECRNHGVDVTSTFQTTIYSTVGHFSNNLLNRFGVFLWIHKISAPEFPSCMSYSQRIH